MAIRRRTALVATLGTQPQVVTVALDLLLAAHVPVERVLVIHTASSPPRPGVPARSVDPIGDSVKQVKAAFPQKTQYLFRGSIPVPCALDMVQLEVEGAPIDDIHDEPQARAVFTTVFNHVQQLKQDGYVIHLSIAGGRKSMSVYGMAAAQILFDSSDRLWHLFSDAGFERSGRMHLETGQEAGLVPIPVLPISTVFPGMVTLLTARDPLAVLDQKQTMLRLEEERDRQEFVEGQLTPAERQLVEELMRAIIVDHRSLSNSELARRLLVATRTVTNRLTDIYAKLCTHLGVPEYETVDRAILVYYLTPFYVAHYQRLL